FRVPSSSSCVLNKRNIFTWIYFYFLIIFTCITNHILPYMCCFCFYYIYKPFILFFLYRWIYYIFWQWFIIFYCSYYYMFIISIISFFISLHFYYLYSNNIFSSTF